MKKTTVLLLLLVSATAYAQQIEIIKKRSIQPDRNQYAHPVINATGEYIAYTTPKYKGLWVYNTKLDEHRKITDKRGAGYKPVFDEENNRVYYRQDQYKGVKKYSSLHTYNIDKGTKKTIQKATRFISTPDIKNGRLVYQKENTLKHTVIDRKKAKKEKFIDVRAENQQIKITYGENTRFLSPKGEGHYLWVSLSPDQSRILFTMAGEGTYISDLHGNISKKIGYLNAPEWLDNNFVTGMRDEDDGHKITASDIFIIGVNENFEYNITNTKDEIEMYPAADGKGSKIAYNTLNGTIKILDIKITD